MSISVRPPMQELEQLMSVISLQSNGGASSCTSEQLKQVQHLCDQVSTDGCSSQLVTGLLHATDNTALLLAVQPEQLRICCLQLAARLLATTAAEQPAASRGGRSAATAGAAAEPAVDVERLLERLIGDVYSGPPGGGGTAAAAALASTTLQLLDQMMQLDHEAHRPRAGELLGIGRLYMFYGLSGWEDMTPRALYPVPQTLHDEQRPQHEPGRTEKGRAIRSSTGKKVPRRKPNERKSIERAAAAADEETGGCGDGGLAATRLWMTHHDSTSDSEAAGHEAAFRQAGVRVRQAALMLIHSVVRYNDKRYMLGFWPSLVPDSPHVPARTLVTVLLKDPAARCRLGAASVLREMLDSSRFFLTGVDDRPVVGAAPFTPYSVAMACLVKELHRSLLLALLAEKSPLTLAAILRALATLVANSPYHRLQPGLLTKVSRHVRAFLVHRDHDVKLSALSVLIDLVSIHEPLPEVFQLLRAPGSQAPSSAASGADSTSADEATAPAQLDDLELYDEDDDEPLEPGSAPRCWLWLRCRAFVLRLRSPVPDGYYFPIPVRVHAMRALCALAKNYFASIVGALPDVADLLMQCMRDEDVSVRLHGARLLECLGDAAAATPPGAAALSLWLQLLAGPLSTLFAPEQKPFVRAAACHALSTVGAGVFERLARDKQLLCVTLVLPLTADDDGTVRSAAVRAAGVFVRLPSLSEDPGYLLDTAEAACAHTTVSHSLLTVRVNAIWTLANLTDSLVTTDRPANWQPLALQVLYNMLTVALRASTDNDKVRVNAVRALGNLLRHLSAEALQDDRIGPLVPEAVSALMRCMSAGTSVVLMKVRWNACYAAGNVFRNRHLPFATASWRPPLVDTLCKLASNFKNFKVRINAALALSALPYRVDYGDQLMPCWCHLLEALETAQNITDFNEFKHRDALLRQVCLTLCHLTSLLTTADLAAAADGLAAHLDTVTTHVQRLPSTLLPEQSAPLLAARDHVRRLKLNRDGVTYSEDQARALAMLESVFAEPQPEASSRSLG